MLLAVDKPSWITSYDVIRALKKVFWKEKIWHSGTLDPMASGLLLIWIGKWTKLLSKLQWLDKTYTTTIDFSKQSDTWDLDYWKEFNQLDSNVLYAPDLTTIKDILDKVIPEYELPLTPFSAKKRNGRKFYELARAGAIVNERRIMKIHTITILKYNFPELQLELDVGSGTYIRSIGHWLGESLKNHQNTHNNWSLENFWWILTSLRRSKIWKYHLENFMLENNVSRFDKKTEKKIPIRYQEIKE